MGMFLVLTTLLALLQAGMSFPGEGSYYSTELFELNLLKQFHQCLANLQVSGDVGMKSWKKRYDSRTIEFKILDVIIESDAQLIKPDSSGNKISYTGSKAIHLKINAQYTLDKDLIPGTFDGTVQLNLRVTHTNFKIIYKQFVQGSLIKLSNAKIEHYEIIDGISKYTSEMVEYTAEDWESQVNSYLLTLNMQLSICLSEFYQSQHSYYRVNYKYLVLGQQLLEEWQLSRTPEEIDGGLVFTATKEITNFGIKGNTIDYKDYKKTDGPIQEYFSIGNFQAYADALSKAAPSLSFDNEYLKSISIEPLFQISNLIPIYPSVSESFSADETFTVDIKYSNFVFKSLLPISLKMKMEFKMKSAHGIDVLSWTTHALFSGSFITENSKLDIKINSIDVVSSSVPSSYEGVDLDLLNTEISNTWNKALQLKPYKVLKGQYPHKWENANLLYPDPNSLLIVKQANPKAPKPS